MYIIICPFSFIWLLNFSTNSSERYIKKNIQMFKHLEAFYGCILHRVDKMKV